MRRRPSGFTLIELLIVISIIGVLAAVLLPQVTVTNEASNVVADGFQLRTHYQWFEVCKQQGNPGSTAEGGHKFVLRPWTAGIVPHTEENFDKFFVPGARDNDPVYREKREVVARGGNPWPDLKSCQPEDTHYAGRAKDKMRTLNGAGEALMADDNDGGFWTHSNGSVNILLADGNVRTLSYPTMAERFGLAALDKDKPVPTFGSESPIPECQKLDR